MNRLQLIKKSQNLKRLGITSKYDFEMFISESTTFISKEDEILGVYLEQASNLDELAFHLKSVEYALSTRSGGMPTISRVFGYQPRITMRRDFCNEASFNQDYPKAYEIVKNQADKAAILYHQHNPMLFEKHSQMADKLKPEHRIPMTPFSSGIINKNNQLRYHYDSGNFKNVWSAMFVMRKDTEGGYLSLPNYGIGIELKNNSLMLFDGQSVLHGVTPINMLNKNSYRLSIVYYSLAGMWKCLTPQEELNRIRKVKTQRETKRANESFHT